MTPSLANQITTHPLLTKKEEAKLAAIIHNNRKGKQEAIDKLVLHNLKLASKIVNEQIYFYDKEDLFTEAVIALQQAAARFKPGFDAKFCTYAAFTIRSRIKRYVGKFSNQVSPSQGVASCLGLVQRFISLYQQEHGAEPTIAQISEILGIEEDRVEEMMQHRFHFVSFDAGEQDGDEHSRINLADTLSDHNAVMPYAEADLADKRSIVQECMQTLNEREKNILSERFGFTGKSERTLESIGKDYGISRERIRQIQEIAFKKLRKRLKTNLKNN